MYIINHQNHPEIMEFKNGFENMKLSVSLQNYYNSSDKTFSFPFPLDAHFIHRSYGGSKSSFFLSHLISKSLYAPYGIDKEAKKECLITLEKRLTDFATYLYEQKMDDIIKLSFVNLITNAQNYDVVYLEIFLRAFKVDVNEMIEFNPNRLLTELDTFGYTPLMVAKSKKFMQCLIEHGAKLDTKAEPLTYFQAYQEYVKERNLGIYKKLGKATYSKREGKTALEIAILDKKKYAIEYLKEKMNEQADSISVNVNDIFQQNYDKIVKTKKTVTRFNLAIREIKANNPILLEHICDDEFREMLSYFDQHGRDFLSYSIKYKSKVYLEKLITTSFIYEQAKARKFKLNNTQEYMNDALINGNKESMLLLYEHQFYNLNAKNLFTVFFYGNLPDLIEKIYYEHKQVFILEAMTTPKYQHLLDDLLKNNIPTQEEIEIAIKRLIIGVLNQSLSEPIYMNIRFDAKYLKAYMSLLHAYEGDKLHIVEEALVALFKNRNLSGSYINQAQKNVFTLFDTFIQEFAYHEKEAFGVFKDIMKDNPHFIEKEKDYLDKLLNSSENGNTKKGRSKI